MNRIVAAVSEPSMSLHASPQALITAHEHSPHKHQANAHCTWSSQITKCQGTGKSSSCKVASHCNMLEMACGPRSSIFSEAFAILQLLSKSDGAYIYNLSGLSDYLPFQALHRSFTNKPFVWEDICLDHWKLRLSLCEFSS